MNSYPIGDLRPIGTHATDDSLTEEQRACGSHSAEFWPSCGSNNSAPRNRSDVAPWANPFPRGGAEPESRRRMLVKPIVGLP